jgi:hypothetical protein
MATAIKKVKSLEVAGQNKYGNDYWEVVWDDDKKDKVFDLGHYETLCEAEEGNLNVEIEKEKKGQYWNIKNVKLVASSETVKEIEKQGGKLVSVEDKMTKEDWDAKDLRTRKSIERQKALEIANEYVKNKIIAGKELTYDDVLKVADHFYDWINK